MQEIRKSRVATHAGSRACATLALLFLAPLLALGQHQGRRAELRKALPNGVTVLFGAAEKDSDPLRGGFFQEPNFFYLTGWREPGAILILTPAKEFLFLPKRNPEEEKWTGRKAGPDDPDIGSRTNFTAVQPAEMFETELRRQLESYPRIYAITDRPSVETLKSIAPLRPISSPANEIAHLRMNKSAEELKLIERATDITIEAHRAAWKRAAAGLYEYQIVATMMDTYLERGCERSAYAPIVGSGPNSTVLHYSRNSRHIDRGELLLMDVAAECSGYASDITRTIPVSGKFSNRQREIYEIVLGAANAAIAAVKPGMTLSKTTPLSIYKVAYEYIDSHGKDLHGNSLGKYFTHGIGHHLGLEVHDAWDPLLPLAAGMVITIEPGIYIPEENLGVRIEDVVLVTATGSKLLSLALPREPGDIERALAK